MRLLLVVVLTACNAPASRNVPAQRFGASPARVVVMAPAAAEILTQLDLDERVIGVGPYVKHNNARIRLPLVGAFDEPNVEIIVSLGADALITSRSSAALQAQNRLQSLGVKIIAVDTSTFAGVLAAIRTLGDEFDHRAQAEKVIAQLQAGMAELREKAHGLSRPRVLVVVGQKPWYAAGAGSHVDAMISAVGGINVLGDSQTPYLQVSLETLLSRLPEIIIDCSDNGPRAKRGRTSAAWAAFAFVPAVAAGRVFSVDPDQLLIPGPRMVEMARFLGQMVHPEVFGEPYPQ